MSLGLDAEPRSESDSEYFTSPDSDANAFEWNTDRGCGVSRRLGTVWSGTTSPSPRHSIRPPRNKIWTRKGKQWRGVSVDVEITETNSDFGEDLSFIIDHHGFAESAVPYPDPDFSSTESHSESDDEDFSVVNARRAFADPSNGDDLNCLNCFAAYQDVDFWSIDMRLTLLWCLAYEARFRRRGPALELWLAIIEGSRERVDWGMWEDGDESWLRDMIRRRRMTSRFRVTASRLSPADWARARDTLQRRLAGPPFSNPMKNCTTRHRVLRIAWCAVTDGFPAVGRQYLNLMGPIDSWTYFTCPLRPSDDEDMKLRLHDQPHCSLSSCKLGVWQWFRTAIPDYDASQIQDIMGCCSSCVSRASSAFEGPALSNLVEEPAIWPVILWVAFQLQTRDSVLPSKSIDILLAIIASKSDEHLGLWSWDDTDEQKLRRNLVSPTGEGYSWIDRYPPSWRKYILLLDSTEWSRLATSTHESHRARLDPPEYDVAIRMGAIVLWTSSNLESQETNTMLTLDRFITAADPAYTDNGFLRCLLERRVPVRANHYELNLGPETLDWHHPRIWLDRNRLQLLSTVLNDPDTIPLVHVVENVYMVHHVARALPLRFMSCVFACLLRKFCGDRCLDDLRAQIATWKTWDTMTCLINFRSVLATTFENSKLIEAKDLPKSLINVVIHTDIRCICAQISDILLDRIAYREFLKAQNDNAQKLLDLLQDLLDYPLLDARIRPVILKALLRLSTKAERHPRCFVLSDLELIGNPVAAGSCGDVWKGLVHGETVSVKVMRVFEETDSEALLKEFYREALIWRQLSHSNLLPFFGVYYLKDTKNRLCLVSSWMENGNIARYLKNNPAGINRLTLILDVALGLEHLHGLKLVHGDLKAINVLVTRSGRAVLADFGLSSVTDSKILLLSTSAVKAGGTVRWQAPELFGGSPNSFASDVYAFSCVCYEILTGQLPFHELTNDAAVIYNVMRGQRPKRTRHISDGVWNLMVDCWKTEPDQRLSADQIVFRLRDRPICALPTDTASDWDPWYTSKFRSSLEEHTLFLSCGKVEDWLQFTQPENNRGIRSPMLSAISAMNLEGSDRESTDF
ncbi:hypothetical protein DFH07DRAFT_811344 [Mycena maculata]|uniref:Protein kinase domain-containing protein n=1 Tax=Mycena maculata TaxID=230809 RepID=A0AAD7JHT3_9AGAR|nr:hypothetical protein DFH07DRAFT_811344 [Mycena maculata]